MGTDPNQSTPRSEACKRGHPWQGDNFYFNAQGRRICRVCRRGKVQRQRAAEDQAQYEKHKAYRRKTTNRRYARLRQGVLDAYGRTCACCGEADQRFLAIDHVNGAGNTHRRAEGFSGSGGFYMWLKKNGYPPGFQSLCHNCNFAKHIYEVCPHAEATDG